MCVRLLPLDGERARDAGAAVGVCVTPLPLAGAAPESEELGARRDFGADGVCVRAALQDAASVAGLLITTEAMIADKPEPAGAGGGMPAMPDMGGMGGMGGMM